MLRSVDWYKLTDVSEVLTASVITAIALIMEAVDTPETCVNFYQPTRRNTTEYIFMNNPVHKAKVKYNTDPPPPLVFLYIGYKSTSHKMFQINYTDINAISS
jgi:hypothetical protein